MSRMPISPASWLCAASLSAPRHAAAVGQRRRPGWFRSVLRLNPGPGVAPIARRPQNAAGSDGGPLAPHDFEADMRRSEAMSEIERASYTREGRHRHLRRQHPA